MKNKDTQLITYWKDKNIMKTEKTIEERLKRYAITQDDSLDRHMPKPKNLFWIALCSPLLALASWLLLCWFAISSD